MDKSEQKIKLENWIKNESGADVVEFLYQWRLNGIVDVYKNGKTVFCMVEGKYQKNISSYESLVSIVSEKLQKNAIKQPNWRKRESKEGIGATITIYTDGSAKPNPGRGGYGVIMMYGEHKKILRGGFRKTTNNRMELLAVIVALESIKRDNSNVIVYSDSKYVIDPVEKDWIGRWVEKKWKTKRKEDVLNKDLWQRFMDVYNKHSVTMCWVKGHNNNDFNERCDMIASEVVKNNPTDIDEGFENKNQQAVFL